MMKNPRNALVTSVVFALVLGLGAVAQLVITPPEILVAERRTPAPMPSPGALVDGTWMTSFEDFLADRFPIRDQFRLLKAGTVLGVLRQTDISGLYLVDGHAGKFEPVNLPSANRLAAGITTLASQVSGQRLYYSVIPDKSIYTSRDFPGYDPTVIRGILTGQLPGMDYIDLSTTLSLDDYYTTDLHWNQARLGTIVALLGDAMGFDGHYVEGFTTRIAGEFSGVYAGQLALPMSADTMMYMTSPLLDNAVTSYLNPRTSQFEQGPIYDLEAFNGNDPYDIFLRGPQPLITLENPGAATERELFIFRDSFGSSLAPLLLPAYEKVTLIDLRYINSRLVWEFVDFPPDSDVLFLYSSQIVNNSGTLMIS
jgi:hypothetical protein